MTPAQNNLPARVSSSFRDPSSSVFTMDGAVYRHIRAGGVPHYRALMGGGLYARLVGEGLLIPHDDVTAEMGARAGIAPGDILIRPRRVPFISYPFEWTFSALKSAALATLRIQEICLDHGMTLQDATAFNIQQFEGRWVLIDTGSLCTAPPGPWRAYRQFCQHFLAPLLLMVYRDARLLTLSAHYLDGVPLDLAARLLPWRARLRLPVLLHIILHSKFALRDFGGEAVRKSGAEVGQASLRGLVDQLSSFIRALDFKGGRTAWTAYEDEHTYAADEFRAKEAFVLEAARRIAPRTVWDFGANTGHFSRLLRDKAEQVVAFESDFMTAEAGARKSRAVAGNAPLHLWCDLLNLPAGYGFAGKEWPGLGARGPADLVLALALVHHICLSGGIPLPLLAGFLAETASNLVIEFVPKDDPQSRRLLKTRDDIFPGYTKAGFEQAMAAHFDVLEEKTVSGTGRTLYLMERRDA